MNMCKSVKMAQFDVSDMEEHSNATVHGMVVEVSPIKANRKNLDVKYFSGKITDGKKVARVISIYFSENVKSKNSSKDLLKQDWNHVKYMDHCFTATRSHRNETKEKGEIT